MILLAPPSSCPAIELLVVGLYFLTEFKRDTYTPPQLKAMDEKNEA